MAKIVEGPKYKRVTCRDCEAVIEYLPEEVRRQDVYVLYSGEADGWVRVKCPRTGCTGYGYVSVW